ncbi:Rust resistance kinase Lr10 [Camellia lanceoleosa]|uniref:Rust resistance kinase Lr10 n=1 Tax=Camellia lanceoleosa TaxID=1840588 RepID=A0ACC0H797_9ERIC|nr:Rust resistance kinase Lr10 [Camellia lanceoleosa]
MFRGRLLFAAGYISLLVHILFCVNCCNSSSCGDIHNITFPFRLKSDPVDNCGYKYVELECENNRTVVYLFSGKYYVQAINYETYDRGSISLVDVGIQRNNCSSLPLHSLTPYNFTETLDPIYYSTGNSESFVAIVSCEKPVKSPIYIDTTSNISTAFCENKGGRGGGGEGGVRGSSSSKKHSYVLASNNSFDWSDVANLCSVDMAFPTRSFQLPDGRLIERNMTSLLEVHNALADGFDLDWEVSTYEYCGLQAHCSSNHTQNYTAAVCHGLRGFSAFLDGLKRYLKYQLSSDYGFLRRCVFQVQVPYKNPWDCQYHNWGYELKFIGGIILARILFGLCAFAFLIRKFKRRHLSMFDNIEGYLRSQNHLMPISYSYLDIKKMAKGFKDKLGEGGYGSVYKGKLRSGHPVAIKVLGKPKANGQEFINEVATIGRIHHVNVVQLIGYCAERSKRALIYDFMPNGSLEKYIFSQEGYIPLSCKQMYEISLGVARGIEYLHRGCDMQILHFDIKPHNILLDENFTPKVSDFGLAKLYSTDDSIVTLTAARGTMGYMAPELFYKNIGGVSYKADVYSFGMLLMEMTGRRRNLNAFADHTSQIYFPSWIYDQFKEGRDIEMGETNEDEGVMVKKMIIVALWCIQMKPSDRPSMNKVVEMLEGNVEQLQMPPKPFLCPQEMPAEDHKIDKNPTDLPMPLGECINSITLNVSEP